MACNHPAKFAAYSHCGWGDITYSICHVTLQDHTVKGSCDFTEGSSTLHVTILPGLVAIDFVVVEIQGF